jgi:N-acetylglucosaminyldiphosphoundecaprenol N-acetyl-beta-D-mannosaminyltransferase
MSFTKVPILGVNISALNMSLVLSEVTEWIHSHEPHYVCVAPAHSIMECVSNPALYCVFNNASMVTPDGMAVVWLLRLKGHHEVKRVYGPDLLLATCEYGVAYGWRHYFFGGAPGVAQLLAECLHRRFPDLQIAGTCSPPFGRLTPEEERALIDEVNASEADIVWVGMSSPRQEAWMCEHLGQVNAPVMIGVGAAFDFLSGRKPQAPRWMQRIGLEWLFRLITEPRRLWPRYSRYPKFIWLVLQELLGRKKVV